jgi:hypothetical protein
VCGDDINILRDNAEIDETALTLRINHIETALLLRSGEQLSG